MAPFADRADAGARLAEVLAELELGPAVVLGIPRGGVVVAAPVARALGAPLDVVVPKKLGAPGRPELGIGAVAPGIRVLDHGLIARLGVRDAYVEAEVARAEAEVERRTVAYRGDRPPLDLTGVTAIVVDDGIATGGTARAALRWARRAGATRVVLAVPVAPPDVLASFGADADDVVALATPSWLRAVGEWYRDFRQVEDREVRAALAAARP
jgi:putative phosphoribosyl transferase